MMVKIFKIECRDIYNKEDVARTQLAYYSVSRPNMIKGIREQIPVLMMKLRLS